MKRIMAMIAVIAVMLSGCWDQRIYEQIGFILMLGVEESKEPDKLLLTYTAPVIGTSEKNAAEIISTSSKALRPGRDTARRESPRTLEAGKIQQILFSESYAKKGIHELLEIFERDPINPALAWVVIVEGSPHDLFDRVSKLKDKPRPAIYINQLLQNVRNSSYIPETRVYDFDINYFAPGIDSITPLIKMAPDNVVVIGSALFSDDRMVGKIDHKQTALLEAMRGTMKRPEYTVKIPENMPGVPADISKDMAVLLRKVKTKIDVRMADNKPEVTINMNFNTVLDEYYWDDLSNPKTQRKLEKYIESSIQKDCKKLVKYMQEVGSDPIGIGNMVRAKYNNYWKSIEWKDVYKDIPVNINIELDIKQFGAIQ